MFIDTYSINTFCFCFFYLTAWTKLKFYLDSFNKLTNSTVFILFVNLLYSNCWHDILYVLISWLGFICKKKKKKKKKNEQNTLIHSISWKLPNLPGHQEFVRWLTLLPLQVVLMITDVQRIRSGFLVPFCKPGFCNTVHYKNWQRMNWHCEV